MSVARHLDDSMVVLARRRVPGGHDAIDHLVVAASGAWVIGTVQMRGKVSVGRALFGPHHLMVDGRDRSDLLQRLDGQVGLVGAVLAELAPGTPVHGALCFPEADLSLTGALSAGDFMLGNPRALARHVRRRGPLGEGAVRSVAGTLAALFPAA